MQQLRLLGPAQVTQGQDDPSHDGTAGAARFRSRRTVALLGYLAVERRPLTRDHLAALFWPDEPSRKGRGNLRRELYNLAQLLPGCWQTEPQTILFAPAAETRIDIDAWDYLISREKWQEAAALPDGDFLEGLYLDDNAEFESWLLAERERWRSRQQMVLRQAAEEARRNGRFDAALPFARRLVRLAPWEEESHRELMRLLAWSGRREEALRQFDICRQALAEELDLGPAPQTVALYERLRAGELPRPPTLPAYMRSAKAAAIAPAPPFVHRERELAWLGRHLDRALAGQGRVVFLTGSSGRGKTALLDAFAAAALRAHPELLIARGTCSYGAAADAYLPFRELMVMLTADVEARWAAGSVSTELARRLWLALPVTSTALLDHGPLLLDIFLSGKGLLHRAAAAAPEEAHWLRRLRDHVAYSGGDPLANQQGLLEQAGNVLGAVARQRPLLLMLDDLQWVDSASIGLLFHLVRRITQCGDPILLVCAYRPDEIMREYGAQPELAPMLGELRRQVGDVWLSLSWPNEPDGRCFVDALLDNEPNHFGEEFRAGLFRRTGGHPLFTVELLRSLRERGDLVQDSCGAWHEGPHLDWQMMPARVEAVIEARIHNLPPARQEVLAVAAMEGETFTAQVVAQVQGQDQRCLLHLLTHELDHQYRLVREQESFFVGPQPVTRFRFRHAMFREYLVRQLGQGERRILQAGIAAALETVYAADLEQVEVQLAHHYRQAGEYGRALQYTRRAAANAARVFAFDQAITHYTRAIHLAGSITPDRQELAELALERGLACAATGQFDPALVDLQVALEQSRAASAPRLQWQVLVELGKLWSSRDYGQAHAMYRQALDLARDLADRPLLAHSLNCLGNWHANAEHPADALQCHSEALDMFEQLGDQPNTADTWDLLGIVHMLRGDYASAAPLYDRAIALFRELGNDPRLVSSLIPRALVDAGPLLLAVAPANLPGDSFALLTEAEQIARRIGSAADEAWVAWARTLLYTVRGQFAPAVAASQHGLQLAATLGHREWLVGSLYASGTLQNVLLKPQQASSDLQQGLDLAQELRSRYWVNHVTSSLAGTYLLLGNWSAAQHCLEAVVPDGTPMDTAGRRSCWARRAELALVMAEPDLALDICERLVSSAPGLPPGGAIPFLWLLRGQALAMKGDLNEALVLLENGRVAAQTRQEKFLLWRFHTALARLHLATGHEEWGQQEMSAAYRAHPDRSLNSPMSR